MSQYTDYIKETIIEHITNTTDEEVLQLVYGILMNSTNQDQSPSAS